jgi:S-adenosylmethionine/arginine decarboxylase-like enzyme
MKSLNPDEGCIFVIKAKANPKRLSSKKTVRDYLEGLTVLCDMTPMIKPVVKEYESSKPKEFGPGISGLIMWAESHAAIHTYPEWRGRVEIVIHSCKPVDAAAVKAWTVPHLLCTELELFDHSEDLR